MKIDCLPYLGGVEIYLKGYKSSKVKKNIVENVDDLILHDIYPFEIANQNFVKKCKLGSKNIEVGMDANSTIYIKENDKFVVRNIKLYDNDKVVRYLRYNANNELNVEWWVKGENNIKYKIILMTNGETVDGNENIYTNQNNDLINWGWDGRTCM